MCGIFGAINCSSIDDKKFEHSVKLLSHRGPDNLKIKKWDSVAFGFTRLAIQDLSELGDQPMSHATQPICIVFNGEIYNYKELRSDLLKEGASFVSESDTEVILNGYLHWGWEKTLEKLEGMFGLALYDEQQRIIYLARDRFGQKPLFFSRVGNGGILFSSEIKSILSYNGHARIDFLSSLNPIFTTGLSPHGRTMFDTVEQLEEGSYLVYRLDDGKYDKKRYFRVSDWVDENLYDQLNASTSNQVCEMYEEAIKNSVKNHLLSDAPLASMFSAGLDSTLITDIAADYKDIDLYYFESELLDDLRYPKYFSEKRNLKLHIEKGQDKDYIFDLPRMVYHYETINKEEGPCLAHLCSFAQNDGFKALLTGDASDELFGGQQHHIDFTIRNSLYSSPVIRNLMNMANKVFPNNITRYDPENPLGNDYLIFPTGNHFNEVPLNCLYHNGERLTDWQHCLNAFSFIKNKPEGDLMAYMLDEVDYRLQRFMIRSDRYGMMESVEVRTPFLDPAVVKLAINTPTNIRLKKRPMMMGFEKKSIIRKLLTRRGYPNWFVNRKKLGTPHNSSPQITKLLQEWPLTNLGELLRIKPDVLSQTALQSYDSAISRIQYSFISAEVLMRMFVNNDSHENISEEFKAIISGNEKVQVVSTV